MRRERNENHTIIRLPAALGACLSVMLFLGVSSGRMICNMAPIVAALGQQVNSHPRIFIAGYNGAVIVGPSVDKHCSTGIHPP